MDNVETPEPTSQNLTAGQTLLKAREKAGLSRADIASRTKVAERHILSIEEDRFEDLAARTYAVGFSRAYARSLGLDEKHIAEMVRSQLDANEPYAPTVQPSFEPGDPARIPSGSLAWLAAGGLILVIGVVVYFWSSVFSPEGELPSLLPQDQPSAVPVAAAQPVEPAPAAAPTGPVVLTADADQIWLRVSDGAGKTLVEKVLSRGETWTVPEDAVDPKLRTARPDALQISVGGKTIAALSDKPETVSNVSLKPADLMGVKSESLAAQPSVTSSSPAVVSTSRASAPVQAAPSPRTSPSPSARPSATASRAVPAVTRTPVATSSPRATSTRATSRPTASPASRPTPADDGAPVSILPSTAPSAPPTAVSTTSN